MCSHLPRQSASPSEEEREEAVQGKGRDHGPPPRLTANYPPSTTRWDILRGRKEGRAAHKRTPPASDSGSPPSIQQVPFRLWPVSSSGRP